MEDFVICLSGTILTLARLANKKFLKEIYYNMFISKDSPEYIDYMLKNAKINSLRMPMSGLLTGDSLNIMSASLYYDDLYTNTTFIVINIQSILEILATLSIRYDENIVKAKQFVEIKYLLYSENSIYDTSKFRFLVARYREDDRFTDDIIDARNR
jgi:hypothetical protein